MGLNAVQINKCMKHRVFIVYNWTIRNPARPRQAAGNPATHSVQSEPGKLVSLAKILMKKAWPFAPRIDRFLTRDA